MKKKKRFILGALFVGLIATLALSFGMTFAAYSRVTSTEQNVSVASRKGFNVYLDATEWDIDGAIFYMYVWNEKSDGAPDGETPKKYLKPIGKTEEGYYIYNYQRTVHNRFLFLRTNPSASGSYFVDDADAFVYGVGWNKTADITLNGGTPLIRIISAYGPNDFIASDGETVLGKISPHECVSYYHLPAEHSGGHGTSTRYEQFDARCEYDGYKDTITWCNVCECEIARSTATLSAIGHNYVSSYQWKTGSSATKEVRTCKNDKTHVIIDNNDAFSGRSTVSSFSINAGTKSELHNDNNGYTTKQHRRDINFHFSNFKNGSSGDKGWPFFAYTKLHITNTTDINKGLAIKIDNTYYYSYSSQSWNNGERVILFSDLSSSCSNTSKINVTGQSDSFGNTSTYSNPKSFSSVFPFINDEEGYDVLISIYFSDEANRIIKVKLTYYPSKSSRAGTEYDGCYQTFTVQYVTADEFAYNYVNSVRILREDYSNSSLQVKELEFSKYWVDRDVYSSGGNNGSTMYTIIDVNDYTYK